jgi:predicted dehydrogenase
MISPRISEVRCGIVGLDAAFWPAAFWQAIEDHADAELVGMCGLGLSPEVITRDFVADVDEWLAAHGQKRVDSLDELLARGVDAAFVCSRNTVMPDVVERLAAAGVRTFVAKPMGVTAADAARYARLGSVTAGQLARTWEPWPTIRRLVEEGRVGRVLSMRAVHQHGRYRDFPPELWYSDPAEGDAFTWLGWYVADAVHALMGPIAAVQGVARRSASEHGDLPDQLAGVFELADGRHATAEVHWTIGPWGMAMHEGEVVGETGVIRSHGPGSVVQVLTADGEEIVPFAPGDGLAAEVDAFLAGAPVISTADAAHILDVCATWREAAGAGRRLEVATGRDGR